MNCRTPYKKPLVYNYAKAEEKIARLEKENKFLKRMARYYTTLGLVHCGECKYGNHIGAGERLKCFHWLHRTDEYCHEPNWFCADGERRTE